MRGQTDRYVPSAALWAIALGIISAYELSFVATKYSCIPVNQSKPILAILGMLGYALTFGLGVGVLAFAEELLWLKKSRDAASGDERHAILPFCSRFSG